MHAKLQTTVVPQRGSRVWRYLDEAVMEMQPDEGGGHPGLPGHGLRHDGVHHLFGLGARVVVELREQAAVTRVADHGAGEEQRRQEAERNQANHGGRH